jgi:hypothetical protein
MSVCAVAGLLARARFPVSRVVVLAFPADLASGCLAARTTNALTAAGPHRICTGFP